MPAERDDGALQPPISSAWQVRKSESEFASAGGLAVAEWEEEWCGGEKRKEEALVEAMVGVDGTDRLGSARTEPAVSIGLASTTEWHAPSSTFQRSPPRG